MESVRVQSSAATYVQVSGLRGSLAGRMFSFIHPDPISLPQPLILGRGDDCHVGFHGAMEIMVSRRHAELSVVDGGVRFCDRSSQGTYILETQQRITELQIAQGFQTKLQLGPRGPTIEVAVGQTVPVGHYALVAKLGEGGMAEVYLAADRRLDRLVVVKLLRPELHRDNPLAEEELLNEARIVAQLEHNHVVRIYELGLLGSIPYIAMEYLRGISLSQLTRQLSRTGRRLPAALAAAITGQACLGLQAAHELPSRVVHRDISHANILVTRDTVKVIDFGIARANNRAGRLPTEPNLTKGCPPYMSPEQISNPQSVTHMSDLFSMAVVLYELCSGSSLFSRDHIASTIGAVLNYDPPPLRSVCPEASERLEALLRRALAKNPADRWPKSAADFSAALKEEAGPYLQQHDHIVAHLEQLGVTFQNAPPTPLTEEPELIRQARLKDTVPLVAVDHSSPTQPKQRSAAAITASRPPEEAQGGAPLPSPLPPRAPQAAAELRLHSPRPHNPQSGLISIALPEHDGALEITAARVPQLSITSMEVRPREHHAPIPLTLGIHGGNSDGPNPLMVCVANKLVELRVASESLKAGRSFRIYPSELTTSGARNSYALPQSCAGRSLWVGHHRGISHVITVASSLASSGGSDPPVLELAEPGVQLVAPSGTERLCVVYQLTPERSAGSMACYCVKRE